MEIDNDNEILKLKSNLSKKKEDILMKNLNECSLKFNNDYELWLDKYKPNEYGDLLTDEKMTRDILSWIKSWDEIVFGKKFESRRALMNKEKNLNEFGGGKENFKKEFEFTHNKFKIILIAGPPGMGKTTLAKVLANHCKYEPIVINASDERTSDKLLLRIYDTTQLDKLKFKKNLGDREKPTCLILDEIDGAMDGQDGKSAVKSIIDFIKSGKVNKQIVNKAKKNILYGNGGGSNNQQSEFLNPREPSLNKQSYKNKNDSDDEDFSKNNKDDLSDDDDLGDKSKKEKNLVKRPIICICNDLYAKVIMHLRKEALVFNVKADPNKLEKRLKEICIREKLNIEAPTIKNLCKQTNYDIRACINTLQFISYNQNNLALMKTLSMDKLQMLGSKDITAGLFEIWNKIFMSSPNPMELTFNSTLGLYNSFGEFERINDGIYVNYISNPTSKNELHNRAKLLEFLSYDDVLTSKINSGHNYEMIKFQSLPGAYAKIKYSSTDKNKNLKFPSLLIDYKKNKKNNFRIISSIKEAFDEECPYSKIGKKSLICDTLPYVHQLIQPEIREINPELMNKKELKQLRTAINIMCQFGIKFHEGRPNEDGEEDEHKTYDPDICELLNFSHSEKTEEIVKKNFFNKGNNSSSKNKFSNQIQDLESLNKNTRITSKQKFIIRGEYEKLKSYKNNIKDIQQIVNPSNVVQDQIKNDKLKKNNFFESQSKKNQNLAENAEDANKKIIKNNMNFGRKRNFSQFADPEYKFVYKYNEGVTNTVRRTLNLNYFFK